MLFKLALILGLLNAAVTLRDIDGVSRQPLRVTEPAKVQALFFVTQDCPISNAFAHEIARVCSQYGPKGLRCTLVYVDPSLSDAEARKHASEYGHGDYPRIVDRRHELVKATGVTITPEAAVVDGNGKLVYRGRIDDSFAALGQPRRPVKNPDLRNALDDVLAGNPVKRPESKSLGCYISDLAALAKSP